MLRPFIVDSERTLLENDDLLGTMCYANYPGIIPMDIVDTLKTIQGL